MKLTSVFERRDTWLFKAILSKKFNNLTNEECYVLCRLKGETTIIIKGADEGSVVTVWDKKSIWSDHINNLMVSSEQYKSPNEYYNESFRKTMFASWFV